MSENSEKRKRGPNFTSNDVGLLIDIASRYKNVIENTQSNKVNNKMKEAAWSKIEREFNAAGPTHQRDIEGLKRCYDNKKKLAKKNRGKLKREVFKTGGGTPPSPPSPLSEKIMDMINKKKVEGHNLPYGGDANLGQCSGSGMIPQRLFPERQTVLPRPTYANDENDIEMIIMDDDADIYNTEEDTELLSDEESASESAGKNFGNKPQFPEYDDHESTEITGHARGQVSVRELGSASAKKSASIQEGASPQVRARPQVGDIPVGAQGRQEGVRRNEVAMNHGVDRRQEDLEEERGQEGAGGQGAAEGQRVAGRQGRGDVQVRAKGRGGRGRRPRTYVKALTTSDLAEKYDNLLDKRVQIAQFQKTLLQNNIRMQAEEHELKIELLQAQLRQVQN